MCKTVSPTCKLCTGKQQLYERIKALANEDTLLWTHCCLRCFLGCANWETFVADTKCFWTKSETFPVSPTQNLCPQQMLRVQENGKHLCRQQRVRNNVSSFARAFTRRKKPPPKRKLFEPTTVTPWIGKPPCLVYLTLKELVLLSTVKLVTHVVTAVTQVL